MSKVRKILIVFLVACISVCLSVAVAACDKSGKFPDYKNPTDSIIGPGGNEENTDGRYKVKVLSAGGLPLDGVQISFMKNGTTQLTGISRNGEIIVNLVDDVYELNIDAESLPAGYYVPEDADYKTSAEEKEVTIKLPSKVIPTSAPSNKSYKLGEVMYDFSYTTAATSERKILSELVGKYKAVMLNFWYLGCGPCRLEFPAINEAYEQFKDKIAIVALSSQDNATTIKNFQEENNLAFDMAYDTAGIESRFGVGAWPTTIIVDRYGAIVYRSKGNETRAGVWAALFAKYTSDNYEQNIEEDESGDTGDNVFKAPPEDTPAPDYSEALSGNKVLAEGTDPEKIADMHVETNEKDKDTSWPWYVRESDGVSYLDASNSGTTPSFAILYIEFNLKAGDIISYDYIVNTAQEDLLLVFLDSNSLIKQYNGIGGSWQTEEAIYIANRDITVTLSFMYYKVDTAEKNQIENDFARIGNISVINASEITKPFDILRSASYLGLTINDLALGNDGFYHINKPGTNYDGALLLVDLNNSTDWSRNHAGGDSFITTNEGNKHSASVYNFSFWEFSNYLTRPEKDTGVTYNYTEYSYYLNETMNIHMYYSRNGYVPVTETMRKILEDFCLKFSESKFNKGDYYEGEWIEMCYVFEHLNGEHDEGDRCESVDDPVRGLLIYDAIPASENVANHVNIDIEFQSVGGFYYSFTAPRAGAYKLYSKADKLNTEPVVAMCRWDGKNEDIFDFFDGDRSTAQLSSQFTGYFYLEENETVYMMMRMSQMNEKGEFDFFIEYVGESYAWLKTASPDGAWVGSVDENGNFTGGSTAFNTEPWALREDGYYYTYSTDDNGNFLEWGSVFYIDFLNVGYSGDSRTLLEWINDGIFNLKPQFRPDYTTKMLSYYYESIENKDEGDELYGKIEASEELVEILAMGIEYKTEDHDSLATGFWLSFGYFYDYIGPKEN